MARQKENRNNGRITLVRDTPRAFIAVSSTVSPSFPYVIMLESKIARGNEKGIWFKEPRAIISNNTMKSSPFPIMSSRYLTIHIIRSKKLLMTKVAKNGPK